MAFISVNCKLKFKCNINVKKLVDEDDSRQHLVLKLNSINDDFKKNSYIVRIHLIY